MEPVLTLAGYGALGFILGYALKKILKVILFVFGALGLLLWWLEEQGIIAVNWDKLNTLITTTIENILSLNTATLTSLGGFGLGFMGGFLLGFKKG